MKYYVLGSGGFIGRNIYNYLLDKRCNVIGLDRKKLNFFDENTYIQFNFNNCTIIDCIVDSKNTNNCYDTNVQGLISFIQYLNKTSSNFKYVYISTYTTLLQEYVDTNNYVHSKKIAEQYVINNIEEYKIFRLIFPFGNGENPERLISRIIKNIQTNTPLVLDNLLLNLIPIEYVTEQIFNSLTDNSKEKTITDGRLYNIVDIVNFLFEIINKKPKYIMTDKRLCLGDDKFGKISRLNDIIKNKLKQMIK